jgi:hypothetical protein
MKPVTTTLARLLPRAWSSTGFATPELRDYAAPAIDQSVDLRRGVHAGLNKGEARNALAPGVFQSPREIRDRGL